MKLRTLGGLELPGTRFTRPKPLLLLAYLLLEGPQRRAHLAELFWRRGDRRKSLSMTLTRLRLGVGEVIGEDGGRVRTTLTGDVKDLLEALEGGNWQGASNLYAGAFLDGVVPEDVSAELGEWLYTTREYLAERAQHALLNLAEAAARAQDFKVSTPLVERAYRLPGLGGNDPGVLGQLYTLLCAGRSLLAPEVRKEAGEFGVTLGLSTEEARSKLFQKTTQPALPLRGTSFVGRDEELTELATLLGKPEVSLLTLLGPAGVGKTRLALQLAFEQQKLATFPDGVYFVALGALGDPNLLPPSLVQQLGLTPGRGEPLGQLTAFLAERNVLLVLDNFEHLGEGSWLLTHLLRGCPRLKMLVTSRERLRLEEEHVFWVTGLAYPTVPSSPVPPSTVPPSDAGLSEAVQLFSERARRVQPRFEIEPNLPAILEICGLVEGLPLGLELAAGWVRVMSCADIAEEMRRGLELTAATRNVPERHRSLRAAFESSWKLLLPEEQAVLRNLSVFVGGFRREAASEVAGATIPLLASLVDKSLLRVLPSGRYDRHPLLYAFTREKSLGTDEHVQAQARHARYELAFAEHADAQLHGAQQLVWFGRLDEELGNLRAALGYLSDAGPTAEPDAALRLATALGHFWNIRGYYAEGYTHLSSLLADTSPADTKLDTLRTRAHLCAGDLLWKRGEHAQAQGFYTRGLECAKTLGERSLQARALLGLGLIANLNLGDFGGARAYYQAALDLAEAGSDSEADALRLSGALSCEQANYAQAQRSYEAAAKLYDALGDPHSRAKSLVNLATVLTYLGNLQEAHALNVQGLELFRAVGDKHGMGVALLNLGIDAGEAGRRREGIAFYQESLALFRALGDRRMVSHLLNNLGGSLQRLGELGEAERHLTESLAIQDHIGDVSLVAHALYILGQVQHERGELEKARQTYGACTELCRKNEDYWTLMRVLEVSARAQLGAGDLLGARAALEEAYRLAHDAGDQKTLQKVLETQTALALAQAEPPQSSARRL